MIEKMSKRHNRVGESTLIMEDILVTIIIPVYNVRPYLIESLESVLNQTYKNLEIILIDDGSTDGSDKICDEYARRDMRITAVHQENKGLSCARNKGLDLMTGSAIAFLDSDDTYHPDFINTMVGIMINKDSGIVMCKYTVNRTTRKMIYNKQDEKRPQVGEGKYEREDALRALADDLINASVWNKLYRAELWENVRFPDGHVCEDLDTTYHVINNSDSLYVLDEPLYLYRDRPENITNTRSWAKCNDILLANSHFYSFVEANTPDIFSKEQKKRCKKKQQECLGGMISFYIHNCKEKKDTDSGEIRKRIIEAGRKIGIDKCNFKTKITYIMIHSCPHFLILAYNVYYGMKYAFQFNMINRKACI